MSGAMTGIMSSQRQMKHLSTRRGVSISILLFVCGVVTGASILAFLRDEMSMKDLRDGLKLNNKTNELEEFRRSNLVIDIDIGTLGKAMDSNVDRIITFDPFDELLLNASLERYPFAVGDFTGMTNFYYNQGASSCSTINDITTFYDDKMRRERIEANCPGQVLNHDRVLACSHPKPELVKVQQVKVKRLSQVLKEKGYWKINRLKIDAQGSDFSIIKDVLENAGHVEIKEIRAECQEYKRTIPLYMTDNDCDRMEAYIQQKLPQARFRRAMNVCWSAEYNLIVENDMEASF